MGNVQRKWPQPPPSEITPRRVFEQRRVLLKALGAGAAWAGGGPAQASPGVAWQPPGVLPGLSRRATSLPAATTSEPLTPYKLATSYNNFYEFSTDKEAPAQIAQRLRTQPWTLEVDGLVAKPLKLGLDDLLRLAPLEDRVYRLRCVEGWSMVVPWVGYPLAELIRRAQPLGSAKFVAFTSLADPAQMPGVASRVLDWPYVEGLRLDEALHPLTLLTLGLYGEVLPKQNGAPVRVVLPWKYGFKSAKSLVRIRLLEQQPPTAWGRAAPGEYGFYANVNPQVDHPRWSQATERRLGEGGLFSPRRKTLAFNGYADQVAGLYAGMDLRRWF